MSETSSFDYIVVGAGTAGCALAGRLAQHGQSVLLIEQGPKDDHPAIAQSRLPALFELWKDRNYARSYVTEPPGASRWPDQLRGVTLGGSGAINVMIHTRGHRRDFDHWAELGNPGWAYEDVLPFFRKSESFEGGASRWRGGDGPIQVRWAGKSVYAQAFEQAAIEYGFHGPDWDFNGEKQEGGVGPYQFAVDRNYRRSSTASAYLPLANPEGTLKVMTGHQVLRVRLEGKAPALRATGVVVLDPNTGRELAIAAGREVIVSGGAFESPKLLMLSGIGPREHLEDFGGDHRLEVKCERPGVGMNLQDHVITSVFFHGNQPLPALDFLTEIGLFVEIGADKDLTWSVDGWPTVQFFMNAGIHERRWSGLPQNFFGFFPSLSRPKSRGHLRLASADPRRDPIIDPKYFDHPDDKSTLANGIRMAHKLAETKAFADLNLGAPETHLPPDFRIKPSSTQAQLENYATTLSRGLWHPVGTCKMGPKDDSMAVVDHELRVHGVGGLRVCDASIMPTIACGNPNATVIMIAEKCAEMILAGSSARCVTS